MDASIRDIPTHDHLPIQHQAIPWTTRPDEATNDADDWEIVEQSEVEQTGNSSLPCCYTIAKLGMGEENWRYIRANCTHWKQARTDQPRRLDKIELSLRFPSQSTVVIPAASAAEALSTLQELNADPNIETLRIERPMSVRYVDTQSWRVLHKQLTVELEKFRNLRNLEIVNPPAEGLTPAEEQRKEGMDRIDTLLQQAVRNRS